MFSWDENKWKLYSLWCCLYLGLLIHNMTSTSLKGSKFQLWPFLGSMTPQLECGSTYILIKLNERAPTPFYWEHIGLLKFMWRYMYPPPPPPSSFKHGGTYIFIFGRIMGGHEHPHHPSNVRHTRVTRFEGMYTLPTTQIRIHFQNWDSHLSK